MMVEFWEPSPRDKLRNQVFRENQIAANDRSCRLLERMIAEGRIKPAPGELKRLEDWRNGLKKMASDYWQDIMYRRFETYVETGEITPSPEELERLDGWHKGLTMDKNYKSISYYRAIEDAIAEGYADSVKISPAQREELDEWLKTYTDKPGDYWRRKDYIALEARYAQGDELSEKEKKRLRMWVRYSWM